MTRTSYIANSIQDDLIGRLSNKIKSLDDKFYGIVSMCLSERRSWKADNNKFHLTLRYEDVYSGACSLCFQKELGCGLYSSITFEVGTLEDCINKAHDYFIVHGGDL